MRLFALLAALVAALSLQCGAAFAQLGGLGLPSVPALPNVGSGVSDVRRDTEGAVHDTETIVRDAPPTTGALARTLLRQHRDVLEADPAGDLVVRGEVLAMAPGAAALSAAQTAGFVVARTDALDGVGDMVTLRAPPGMSARQALAVLQRADPHGVYDFDHIHLASGANALDDEAASASGVRGQGPRVGLVDGGVAAHPSLDGAIAEQRAFAGANIVATAHATAVASLLAGRGSGVEGAAPNAQIYAADIYGGQPTGGSSAALARALSWFSSESIPVINVSLVGPRNRIVEALVEHMVARGFIIVAAVGNGGPAAPPLYPAAYAGVVGVTGVDQHQHVLIEAEQGPQVMFAAPGTPMAASGRGAARVRGTSFAAPIVAGLLAARLRAPDGAQAERALASLRNEARDLGARGRDNVYGYGLVGAAFLMVNAH